MTFSYRWRSSVDFYARERDHNRIDFEQIVWVLSALAPTDDIDSRMAGGFSGGLQHIQDGSGAAKEVESPVVGGDWLVGSGAATKKVA